MISFNSPTIKLHLWPTAFLGSALTNKLFSLGFIIISLSALLACSFPSMSVAAPRVEKKSQERNVHIGVYKLYNIIIIFIEYAMQIMHRRFIDICFNTKHFLLKILALFILCNGLVQL